MQPGSLTASQSARNHPWWLTLTVTNDLIGCSCGVGWSAELSEFPDQEVEGWVLHARSQTGRADRELQVSIFFHSFIIFPCCLNINLLHYAFIFFSVTHILTYSYSYLFYPCKHFHVVGKINLCRHTKLLISSYLIAQLFIPSICSIISWSINHPGCLDRSCQQTTYCFPVWPLFLLTWCYCSHSRPAQCSIWAAYVCVCVWEWPWAQCPVSCWSCDAH